MTPFKVTGPFRKSESRSPREPMAKSEGAVGGPWPMASRRNRALRPATAGNRVFPTGAPGREPLAPERNAALPLAVLHSALWNLSREQTALGPLHTPSAPPPTSYITLLHQLIKSKPSTHGFMWTTYYYYTCF